MKREENPCFNCTDRKALCHIGCKRAKKWEEKRKAEKEKLIAARERDKVMQSYQNEKCERYKNYKTGKYYGK